MRLMWQPELLNKREQIGHSSGKAVKVLDVYSKKISVRIVHSLKENSPAQDRKFKSSF